MTENEGAIEQNFGGRWTATKLNIFIQYVNSYLTALKNQPFSKIYIDAFAGTGEIILKGEDDQQLAGSVKIVLEAEQKFDEYYFIEKASIKADELKEMISKEYSGLQDRIHVICGDANEELKEIFGTIDWKQTRGLLFLDPYATQVNWNTLEGASKTKALDVWYLFPYYAMNRMLPTDKNALKCDACLDRLLGTSEWRDAFYKEDPQINLFAPQEEHERKNANLGNIKEFLLRRLEGTFAKVSNCPCVFKNSKNSPLFIFFFVVSNSEPKAWGLALKMANYILKKNAAVIKG